MKKTSNVWLPEHPISLGETNTGSKGAKKTSQNNIKHSTKVKGPTTPLNTGRGPSVAVLRTRYLRDCGDREGGQGEATGMIDPCFSFSPFVWFESCYRLLVSCDVQTLFVCLMMVLFFMCGSCFMF